MPISGGASVSVIVPVACSFAPLTKVAPCGFEKVTVKDRLLPKSPSPLALTCTSTLFVPGANVSVPEATPAGFDTV